MSTVAEVARRTKERRYSWPIALPVFIVAAALGLVAYSDAVITLAELWWESSEFGHGVLVPLVIAYVLWLDHARLAHHQPRLWSPGVLAVAAVSGMWLISRTLGVLVGEHTALMLMFPALALVLFGPRTTWALAFVLLYPFVASPLWAIVNPLLQDITAQATTVLVREVGVPVYREGNYLTIAYGRFLIAEFCSGLRFLLAAISLASLFAYLNIHSLARAAVFMLAAAAAALLVNWIRVSVIVVIGHVSEMQHPMIKDHIFFGWVVFTVSMVPLVMFGYWLGRRGEIAQSELVVGTGNSAPLDLTRLVSLVVISAGVTLLGPFLTQPVSVEAIGNVRAVFADRMAALEVPGWHRSASTPSGWKPFVAGVDDEMVLRFSDGEHEVELYVAVFAEQRQGAEVVNDRNRAFDLETYRTAAGHREGSVVDIDGRLRMARSVIVPTRPGAGRELLVLQGLRVAGEYSHGKFTTKLRQFKVLWGAPKAAMVVAVATPVRRAIDDASDRASGFMRAALPGLSRAFDAFEAAAE